MSTTSTFGSATATRPSEALNLAKLSRQQYLRRRLRSARSMRDFRTNQPFTWEEPFRCLVKIFSTAEIDSKWESVYNGARNYVMKFAPLLRGYLAALDIELGRLDTARRVLDSLTGHAGELEIFGAKPTLAQIARELQPYFQSEPRDNVERGAFIEFLDAFLSCMPRLKPAEAQEHIEIYMGRRLHPAQLLYTPHEFHPPPQDESFSADILEPEQIPQAILTSFPNTWETFQTSSAVLTPFSFSIKWENFQKLSAFLLSDIAAWKMAVFKEIPRSKVVKTVFLVPGAKATPMAIMKFMDKAGWRPGPTMFTQGPLQSLHTLDLFDAILASSENIRMQLEGEQSTFYGPMTRHGSQLERGRPSEGSAQPFDSASSQSSDGSFSDSPSESSSKKRQRDSEDEAPAKKKQA